MHERRQSRAIVRRVAFGDHRREDHVDGVEPVRGDAAETQRGVVRADLGCAAEPAQDQHVHGVEQRAKGGEKEELQAEAEPGAGFIARSRPPDLRGPGAREQPFGSAERDQRSEATGDHGERSAQAPVQDEREDEHERHRVDERVREHRRPDRARAQVDVGLTGASLHLDRKVVNSPRKLGRALLAIG